MTATPELSPDADDLSPGARMLKNVDEGADVIPQLMEEGLEAAMKRLHTKD